MREKEKKYRVIIVGAGNIGAFYDTPTSKNIVTHAHAFSTHHGFELVGFVDKDIERSEKAAKIWGGRSFASNKDAFKNETIDIAVNATPDKIHYAVLKELLHLPVSFIFAEKPMTRTLTEAGEILKLAKQKKIGIAVNYRRRFVPEFSRLKEEIKSGKYGEYLAGNGYYGKGIAHNGSHIIDLLQYFIGDISGATALTKFKKSADPEASAMFHFKDGKNFILQNIDHRNYTIFELDLVFSRSRIRIIDSGFKIEMQIIKDDPIFPGYRNMETDKIIKTSLDRSLYFGADNIYEHLTNGKPLDCSLADGYASMKAIDRIISSL